MEPLQVAAAETLDLAGAAAQRPAQRMWRRVEHAEQRVDGDGARIVVGLLDLGQQLTAAGVDLVGREGRRAHDGGDHRQHVVEILGQAGRADDTLGAAGRRAERGATALDALGDGVGVERLGAAVEHPRGQRRGAGAGGGIGGCPRGHPDGQ